MGRFEMRRVGVNDACHGELLATPLNDLITTTINAYILGCMGTQ
jgi:hypothetical protein